MSRFFQNVNDSESSDSDFSSSSDSEISENELEQKQTSTTASGRFARAAYDSDSDTDVKRVMKNPREKQMEETVKLSTDILKAMRTDEWQAVSVDYEKLLPVVKKLTNLLKGDSLPRVFIRCLAKLEDRTIKDGMNKEQLSKLKAADARAFNKMKQRMRKDNKSYAKDISSYRENPVDSADEEASAANAVVESDSDDEDQAVPSTQTARAVPKAKQAARDSDMDSDDSQWDMDDSEVSSSESEDERQVGFSRWLKKAPTKDESSVKKTKKDRSQRSTPAPAAQADEDEDDGFTTVGKGGKVAKKVEVTAESLNKHLKAIRDARGRKGTDKKETVVMLDSLLGVAGNALQRCKVLMTLISAQFDESSGQSYMPVEQWKRSQSSINELLSTLEANRQLSIFETADAHDDDSDVAYAGEEATLRGSVVSFIDRLDDEFTRSLQTIDPHTPDYIERMRDSVPLYVTIARAQSYFERAGLQESLCRVVLRRIEHLYYRTDQVNSQVEAAAAALKTSGESRIVSGGDIESVVHGLCTFLYQHADPLLRMRAMLMHIFNHALHKRYYVARDLLLMSHIQESAHQADINTQVLYNRALAQMGLAAFRLGLVREAFEHTVELMSSGHQRELLAQGVGQMRTQQLSPAEEQLQRQRQLPFHININLELLECVFLTASMLIEIPFMASANANPETRRTATCRVFRRMLDYNERQVFLGPPENTRDHIMAAAKALADGDWVAARDFIQAIKIWSLLPDCEEIKDMMASKIQIEALRTYLFTYSTQFESVGLDDLATMFDLPRGKVYSLLARMVYQDELQASLDEVSGVLVFSRANFEASSRLQQTALMMSNKVNAFADINERMFELKNNGGQAPGDRQGNADQGGRGQGDRDSRSNYQRGPGGGNRDAQRNRKDGGAGGNRNNNGRNNNNNNRRGGGNQQRRGGRQ
ncbi:Translation initiation factor 3 subunit c [Coemansia sp. RSA 1591]|nr:Translation initiation factor 3 subunit c [Coemansia sp. RSA 1591]KAJ1765487.1 Translation initiation factor 3 subunit c [Coemansia sp. RSA 1752]KAJ1793742.1 Translation initiation factor 3 subunit c [Coemansia sp. RSA 1938]KAJ2149369.1 Translation initiation factor 3 subunit c [Coemansia sp. RSA 564]